MIFIDGLQYCNWSEKIFRQMKDSGLLGTRDSTGKDNDHEAEVGEFPPQKVDYSSPRKSCGGLNFRKADGSYFQELHQGAVNIGMSDAKTQAGSEQENFAEGYLGE